LAQHEGNQKVLLTEKEWAKFWEIVQSLPIVHLVREQIQNHRANILAYLRTEGLHETESAALVDIGWHLMVQTGLQKLLGGPDRAMALRGYYLGVNFNRMPAAIVGKSTALFYAEAPDRQSISIDHEIFKRVTVLEHVFGMAPHGTVLEHSTTGLKVEPVCPVVTAPQAEIVREVEQAIEEFCIGHQACAKSYVDDSVAREILNELIKTWCATPNATALDALAHVYVSDDPNNLHASPLLEPWRSLDVAKMLIPMRWHRSLKINVRYPFWPEAALQLRGSWPAAILRWRKGAANFG